MKYIMLIKNTNKVHCYRSNREYSKEEIATESKRLKGLDLIGRKNKEFDVKCGGILTKDSYIPPELKPALKDIKLDALMALKADELTGTEKIIVEYLQSRLRRK